MARPSKKIGQRENTTSESGQKTRSSTSTPHTGSRVEPSHVTQHRRDEYVQKSAKNSSKPAMKQMGRKQGHK